MKVLNYIFTVLFCLVATVYAAEDATSAAPDSLHAFVEDFCTVYPEHNRPNINAVGFATGTLRTITATDFAHMLKHFIARITAERRSSFVAHDSWTGRISPHPDELTHEEDAAAFEGDLHQDPANRLPFVEKLVVRNGTKIIFLGDLHGSAHSLLRNLMSMVCQGLLNNDFKLAPDVHNVFLGDFVDRGAYGSEVLYLVTRLKLANWANVHLVRGNHESVGQTQECGFLRELHKKFGKDDGKTIYNLFATACKLMPLALFLGVQVDAAQSPVFIQCCHGGVEPFYQPAAFLAAAGDVRYDRLPGEPHLLAVRSRDGAIDDEDRKEHYTGQGFQWSDVTGRSDCGATVPPFVSSSVLDFSDVFGVPQPQWLLNGRRDGAGFKANIEEVASYLASRGLRKMIRGHQDQGYCCKLVQEGMDELWWWQEHPACKDRVAEALEHGLPFADMPDCITLTTAAEGRGTNSEGYGVLDATGAYEDWRFFIYENIFETANAIRRDGKYLKIDLSESGDALLYTWVTSQRQAGLTSRAAPALFQVRKPFLRPVEAWIE